MKTLSLWQPWASLMAAGLKTIETRSWPTRYRGPLAIHAAKRLMSVEEHGMLWDWQIEDLVPQDFGGAPFTLPFGAIVAVVELWDCVCTEEAMLHAGMSRAEEAFGNYAPGRWAWITKEPRKLREPIPWRGMQGLFEAVFPVPDAEVRRCRVCGCMDDDCSQCIAKTGEPCHWVEPDLCSACAGEKR